MMADEPLCMASRAAPTVTLSTNVSTSFASSSCASGEMPPAPLTCVMISFSLNTPHTHARHTTQHGVKHHSKLRSA